MPPTYRRVATNDKASSLAAHEALQTYPASYNMVPRGLFKQLHLPPKFYTGSRKQKTINCYFSLHEKKPFINPSSFPSLPFFPHHTTPHHISSPFLSLQMSVITEKSPKDCASKKATTTFSIPKLNKKLYLYLSTLLLSLLSLLLLIYLTLHPSKPHFSLQQADIDQLNLSGPSSLLNSSIQITLQSENPNTKLGIYYDEFILYASYKGQRITPEAAVSPFYQDHGETNLLSASLVGFQLPVAPSFVYEVQRDQGAGRLALSFKGMGRLRWRVGSWVSGRYRFIVSCVAVMPLGPAVPSPPLRSRSSSECSTVM